MASYREKKRGFRQVFEKISPILIKPGSGAITISFSKRFLLFEMIRQMADKIEDDPYLNFISVLKNYKLLGRFLHGTIKELHRDRNKFYFKNFFPEKELYMHVKRDLEWVYDKNKDLKLTITKKGLIIYDNYKKNTFNTLLMTIHSGTWMPKHIAKKQTLTTEERLLEEDIDTHKIYSDLVLSKGGIWIDSKFSRFACDCNRSPERAIYTNNQEKFMNEIWKEELTKAEKKELLETYAEFYFTLGHLIETYRFNIIFDAHSMSDDKDRPQISFGTKYIPTFYMPVVRSIQRKFAKLNYNPVSLNKPYSGGYILKWMNKRFPDVFIFSMEVNKTLYMTKNRRRTVKKRLLKLSENIVKMFDIEDEQEERE